jgi:hypothetical protein
MGNWRHAQLRGTLASRDIAAAEDFVSVDYERWHPLAYNPVSGPGLGSLGMWVAEEIHADGNLSERDYSDDSVVDTLRRLVEVAPSLVLKVHLGDDWESEICTSTITVFEGAVDLGEPEVRTVPGVSNSVAFRRLLAYLAGGYTTDDD